MIRAVKYIYWYIMAFIAYLLSRKELSGKVRWQYYCWMTASRKSKPKVSRYVETSKEEDNNDVRTDDEGRESGDD